LIAPLFIQVFQNQRPDDFSLEALEELYDYLTENERLDDRENKLDVIEITSNFAEVTIEQFNEDYETDLEDMDDLIRSDRFIAKVDDDWAIIRTEV
jgi:hypothetical protein